MSILASYNSSEEFGIYTFAAIAIGLIVGGVAVYWLDKLLSDRRK